MATTIVGSLAINPLVAIASHPAGSLSFGPLPIPAGYSVVSVTFDLQQVSSLTANLSASLQLSFDGGQTFGDIGGVGLDLSVSGFTLNGSTLTRSAQDPLGAGPVRCFGRQIQLPHTELSNRQLQGVITSSEALISGVSLVAF